MRFCWLGFAAGVGVLEAGALLDEVVGVLEGAVAALPKKLITDDDFAAGFEPLEAAPADVEVEAGVKVEAGAGVGVASAFAGAGALAAEDDEGDGLGLYSEVVTSLFWTTL